MLKKKRYRAEPTEPLGAIRTGVVSLNRVAMDLIGNPMQVTLTSRGRDLIVLPGGPLKVRVYGPTGSGMIRVDHVKLRSGWNGGRYRVTLQRHLHIKGLVFQGALMVEQSWVQPRAT